MALFGNDYFSNSNCSDLLVPTCPTSTTIPLAHAYPPDLRTACSSIRQLILKVNGSWSECSVKQQLLTSQLFNTTGTKVINNKQI